MPMHQAGDEDEVAEEVNVSDLDDDSTKETASICPICCCPCATQVCGIIKSCVV